MVEQRTETCVPGSIPGSTPSKTHPKGGFAINKKNDRLTTQEKNYIKVINTFFYLWTNLKIFTYEESSTFYIYTISSFSQDCSDILISVTHTDCDSYEWDGNILDISGEYVYTTTLANGCDSIVTLDLQRLMKVLTQHFLRQLVTNMFLKTLHLLKAATMSILQH